MTSNFYPGGNAAILVFHIAPNSTNSNKKKNNEHKQLNSYDEYCSGCFDDMKQCDLSWNFIAEPEHCTPTLINTYIYRCPHGTKTAFFSKPYHSHDQDMGER